MDVSALEEQITQMNSQVEASHSQLAELQKHYCSAQEQLNDVMQSDEVKNNQLAQVRRNNICPTC